MTFQELHRQITAYVDNRVDAGEYRRKLEQQIRSCPECRSAYETEMKTRLVVRDRFVQEAQADALRRQLAAHPEMLGPDSERRIGGSIPQIEEDWLDRFATDYLSTAGIVIASLAVILAGGFLFYSSAKPKLPLVVDSSATTVSTSSTAGNAPVNFFNKASDDFESTLAGRLPMQTATSESKELENFFKSHGIDYQILFLPLRLPLAGGGVAQHGPSKLAQIVYTDADTLIHVTEIPHNALVRGDAFYVTPDVLQRLDHGEAIWVEQIPGHPLVMFKRDDLVIAAVTNMSRSTIERMLGH